MEAVTVNNLSTVLELVFFFGLFANWIIYSLWMIWFDKQGSPAKVGPIQHNSLEF